MTQPRQYERERDERHLRIDAIRLAVDVLKATSALAEQPPEKVAALVLGGARDFARFAEEGPDVPAGTVAADATVAQRLSAQAERIDQLTADRDSARAERDGAEGALASVLAELRAVDDGAGHTWIERVQAVVPHHLRQRLNSRMPPIPASDPEVGDPS
jgi:hypothetical protein